MPRPITLEDLPRLARVGDPAISGDGRRVAFTATRWDLDADRYRTEIWCGAFDDPASAHPVTSGRHEDGAPALSPDGSRLVFVSDRDEGAFLEREKSGESPKRRNLWLLDLGAGGEAVRLTALDGSVSAPLWSPNGETLAFLFQPRDPEPPRRRERIAAVLEQAGETLPEAAAEELHRRAGDEKGEARDGPVALRVTRLHWREDARGVLPARRRQLWALDLGSRESAGAERPAARHGDGRLRRLTAGPYDVESPCISPDGSRIAFVSNRSNDPDRTSGLFDLWIVPAESGARGGGPAAFEEGDAEAEGIAEPQRVPAPDGPKAEPAWSPDGTRLAYSGHTEPLDLWGATNWHVWSAPVPDASGGEGARAQARDLAPGFDRTAQTGVISDLAEMSPSTRLVWREEGSAVAFLATEGGSVGLFQVPASGGEATPVELGERTLGALAGDASGRRLVFLSAAVEEPVEVWTMEGTAPSRRYSRVTHAWRQELDLQRPQRIPVPVPDEGHTVEAWLLKPPGFDPAKRYPLVLQIHGGPYAAYGNSLYFEFQWLAAKGYCVLYANPRGSQGYGYEFGATIRHDLAAPAYRDLMAAVDLVAAREYVDESRMGVTGGSWGGYMTNWVVTQTDRFRAAVTQRSISDFESDFGSSDYGYETEFMLGGPPWTHREVYERCSPLTYVERIRTPLLILHSEEDWRCPPIQSELLFTALKVLGREVELVRFPSESHGLSRGGTPSRRLARLRVIAGWFDPRLEPANRTPDPAAEPAEASPRS